MIDLNANILIKNLLKQADMASQPGTVNVKNRSLDFHVFDRNRLKQHLSKLPEVVKQSLEKQISDFDKAFSQFPSAQHKDYSGMLRIAYAEDRLISEEKLSQLQKQNPQLVNTAQFVRDYGIQLPPDSAGVSNGQKIDKGIGSKHWFSIFGYAYQDLGATGKDYHVNQKRNKVARQIQENVTGKQYRNSINGTFQVVAIGQGFTFAIVSEGGTTYVFDSTVTSNSITMRKFFNEPIIMGKSAVYVTQDHISYINNADAIISQNPEQEKFIWGIFADQANGSFYLQKKSRYGAGGRPAIDRDTGQKIERTVGDKVFLNFNQVQSLANQNTLGKVYRVTAQSEEDFDAQEVASGYKYVYTIEDENTIQKIINPRNREEFAYSVPALKQLRQWLENNNKSVRFDDNGNIVDSAEDIHTSLEGFIIYMAGPDFSSGSSFGEGKTFGKHDMVQNKDIPENDMVTTIGNDVVVKRETFVVVAKQISIPRMIASERYYENKFSQKKIVLSPWREVRSGLSSLSEAVAEMKKIIVGSGGRIVEDNEGNLVMQDPLSRLQPDSRGIQKADKAFQEFRGNQPPKAQLPQAPQRPPEQIEPPDVGMGNIANSLIRRLNSNV